MTTYLTGAQRTAPDPITLTLTPDEAKVLMGILDDAAVEEDGPRREVVYGIIRKLEEGK